MRTNRRAIGLFAFLVTTLHAGQVEGQPVTSLYGIVRGSDHTVGVPQNWEVSVSGFYSGSYQGERTSDFEIYLYNVPRTLTEVELKFASPGYVTQLETVSLGGRDGERVPNVTLEVEAAQVLMSFSSDTTGQADSIRVVETPEPSEVRDHLREQALLTEGGGPELLEAFEWNLQLMEVAYRDSPGLLQELESFKADPLYQRLTVSFPDADRRVFRALIEQDFGGSTDLPDAELLHFLEDRSRSSTVRDRAIRALSKRTLDQALHERTLHFLRGEAREARSALLPALLTALARIGDESDRAGVLRLTTSTDPSRVRASIGAIQETNLSGGGDALAELVQSSSDADVRLAAVRALGVMTHPAAIPALAEAVKDDSAVAVRVEAVRALNRIEASTPNEPDVQDAIRDAQRDPAPEVRREALRVRSQR